MARAWDTNVERQEGDKNYVVLGIFSTRNELEQGISALQANGFKNGDVSALVPWPETSHEFAHKASSKAPEGATTGVAAGAIAGGALGWLVGVGTLTIPGFGPLLAAGPLVGALAGLGAGSAVGGVAGGLIGMGFPEYEAKRYEGQVKKGGFLLSVHCVDSSWRDKAKDILERAGAADVSSTHEARVPRREGDGQEEVRRIPPTQSV
jgi:hypothetical protein